MIVIFQNLACLDNDLFIVSFLFFFSGINFNKDFGQHILKNPLVVDSMIEKVS